VDALTRLYSAARLFVNFFQPSFKLKEKIRTGSRILKRYHAPETPTSRLLASNAVSSEVKARLHEITSKLDPLQLLDEIRRVQHHIVRIADGESSHATLPQRGRSLTLPGKSFHGVACRRSAAHSSVCGEAASALANSDRPVPAWLESGVRMVG